MQSRPEEVPGREGVFTSTHWSVIVAAGKTQSQPEARAALAELCQNYWGPIYTFIRGRGYSAHDSEDLTQSFFAYLLEHKTYMRADPAKGKFRTFLLAAVKNFLSDAYDRAQALKRGGNEQFVPLEKAQVESAESLYQTHHQGLTDDVAFERSWADALVTAGLEQLANAYQNEGREKVFETLKIYLTGSAEPLPSYEDLAKKLGTVASTLRADVTRMRARYRSALRQEVRRTVATDAEVEGELQELLRVLTNR